MAVSMRSTASSGSPSSRTQAKRLGYDIFISFSLGPQPRGTQSYASDLARRLRERDFTVFFSEEDTAPGDVLDATLVQGLQRSMALVVVANRGTLAQPRWVRTEVEEFRRRHPTRPVIPIIVGDALADAALAAGAKAWLTDAGKIWLDESEAAVVNGIASDQLVQRLATVPHRMRSNVKWRWLVRGVVAGLVALSTLLAGTTWLANERDARARAELARAVSLRLVSDAQSMLAGERSGGDERALQQMLAAWHLRPGPDSQGGMLAAALHHINLQMLVPLVDTPLTVAFSPDGTRLVVGGFDGQLRWYDAATGQPAGQPILAHAKEAMSVAFMPDGERLVSGGADGSVRLWDTHSGAAIGRPMLGHDKYVTSVAVSADGRRIVSASGDKTLRLWDARTGQPLGAPLTGHSQQVHQAVFSPDGARVASVASDGELRIWDVIHGTPLGDRTVPSSDSFGGVNGVAYSPDGRQLFTGRSDSWQRWDALSGMAVGEPVPATESGASRLVLSPDGSRVLAAEKAMALADNSLRQWRSADGQAIGQPFYHRGVVSGVAYSADGRRIASVGRDDTLRVWDADGGVIFAPTDALGLDRTAFSLDGSRMASGGVARPLTVWNLQTNQQVGSARADQPDIHAIAFSPDGKRFATGSLNGSLRLWDADTGQAVGDAFESAPAAVWCLAFSPNGKLLVVGDGKAGLQVRDVASGHAIGEPFRGHTKGVTSVAFSADGQRMVSTSHDGTARVWEVKGGRLVKSVEPLPSRFAPTERAAFSTDGRSVVFAIGVQLYSWDVSGEATDKAVRFGTEEHQQPISSLAFSPDGRTLASGSGDRTVRLWDLATRRPIGAPIKGHGNAVVSLGFSADSSLILSGSTDGVLRRWPAPAVLPKVLCAKLTRNPSAQQWRDWVSTEIAYISLCPGLPQPTDAPTATQPGPAKS